MAIYYDSLWNVNIYFQYTREECAYINHRGYKTDTNTSTHIWLIIDLSHITSDTSEDMNSYTNMQEIYLR